MPLMCGILPDVYIPTAVVLQRLLRIIRAFGRIPTGSRACWGITFLGES